MLTVLSGPSVSLSLPSFLSHTVSRYIALPLPLSLSPSLPLSLSPSLPLSLSPSLPLSLSPSLPLSLSPSPLSRIPSLSLSLTLSLSRALSLISRSFALSRLVLLRVRICLYHYVGKSCFLTTVWATEAMFSRKAILDSMCPVANVG